MEPQRFYKFEHIFFIVGINFFTFGMFGSNLLLMFRKQFADLFIVQRNIEENVFRLRKIGWKSMNNRSDTKEEFFIHSPVAKAIFKNNFSCWNDNNEPHQKWNMLRRLYSCSSNGITKIQTNIN